MSFPIRHRQAGRVHVIFAQVGESAVRIISPHRTNQLAYVTIVLFSGNILTLISCLVCCVRRDNIDRVRRDPYPVFDLLYSHPGNGLVQIGEDALVSWIQMLNYDKGHPGVRRHTIEELLERVQPASGRAMPTIGKSIGALLPLESVVSGWLEGRTICFERAGLGVF